MQQIVCLTSPSTIQYSFSMVFDQVVPVDSRETDTNTKNYYFHVSPHPCKLAYMPLRLPGRRFMVGGVNIIIFVSITPSSHSSDSARWSNTWWYSSRISWRMSKGHIMTCACAIRGTIVPPCSCKKATFNCNC